VNGSLPRRAGATLAAALLAALAPPLAWIGFGDATARQRPPVAGDLDLVPIPAGSCTISDVAGVGVYTVAATRPFLLARSEVSQALWRSVMGQDPSREHGAGLPVEWISWDDCQEFLRRLSQRDGRAWRLPSESEWEYACRAGNADGRGDGTSGTYVHTRALVPIDACPANAWGLRGMDGNVWEWCADALPDGRRAMRGGSCNLYPVWCPPHGRLTYPPGFRHERRGLRLALDDPGPG
jgi:formylglycine-generating enzyme required for sulfatase activity